MRWPTRPAAARARRAPIPPPTGQAPAPAARATGAASRACGARRAQTRMPKHPSPLHRPRRRLSEAQERDEPHRLSGDPPRHLALAVLAVAKDDRHLYDAKEIG